MDFQALRAELTRYFWEESAARSDDFYKRVYPILDAKCTPDMDGFARKALQYETITDACHPILFHSSPFYNETGTMFAHCDGAGEFRGHTHAGNWNYQRSEHLFADQDPDLFAVRSAQGEELLYLICGPYCDTRQHFLFNVRPVLTGGLKCMYEKAQAQLAGANEEEAGFLRASMAGLQCLKRLSEKFSAEAARMLETVTEPSERARLEHILDSAAFTPWNAPRTFYEALNTLAFLRTVCGSLEGVGYNTFGRPDVDLLPFYEADIAAGRLTKREAEELIRAFLLTWDCRYDHDMKMVGYADHELENTYTLGGCDRDGNPVWNDITEMFLRVTREEKIIFPKITVRYDENSPREYLDCADEDVIHGTSSILYQNDNATIASLIRAGRPPEDARDYVITGCWGLYTYGNTKHDCGNYVNLLKVFEWSVHNRTDKMAKCALPILPLDGAASFEEVYDRTVENCRRLMRERNRMTLLGKGIWPQVDPLPLTSSSLVGCLDNRKDLTQGGCKYHDESYLLVGFPNIIDSLLAIRSLCFEAQICTLDALLTAVRQNWEGHEALRRQAIACACWGDGTDASCTLAARFQKELYDIAGTLRTLWPGGRVNIGHLTYTEIRFWAEKTLATPDGRHNGEYFSQGLTPSRLHRLPSVTTVIASLAALDKSTMGANNVVNIILPSTRMTLPVCEAFLRASAQSSLGTLQLNCTTREELLDAQKHPEKYPDLIVRVCGFSARFTALSPEWQAEVLSRCYYE